MLLINGVIYYALTTNPICVNAFKVLDPDVNVSDHLPLSFTLLYTESDNVVTGPETSEKNRRLNAGYAAIRLIYQRITTTLMYLLNCR